MLWSSNIYRVLTGPPRGTVFLMWPPSENESDIHALYDLKIINKNHKITGNRNIKKCKNKNSIFYLHSVHGELIYKNRND